MSENGHTNGRRKRPDPVREQPIRNWSTLFGPPKPGDTPADFADRTDDSGEASPDAVSHGVDTAYRVIDDYLRRGQAAAKKASGPAAPQSAGAPNPTKLAERMFQYASDLTSVWLELMQTMMLGTVPAEGRQGASVGPFKAGGSAGGRESARPHPASSVAGVAHDGRRAFAVEVDSKRRLEVSWELRTGIEAQELSVHPPRAVEPEIPPLADVTVQLPPSENRTIIRIRVADDQPAGSYSGVVVDRLTNVPVGTLLVRVFPSP